jgi:hypothetical protein
MSSVIVREPTPAESHGSHSSITSPPPSITGVPIRGGLIARDRENTPPIPTPAEKAPSTKTAVPGAKYAPTGDSKGIPINRAGQRIDRRLRAPTTQEQERFEARIKYRKLCNEHHLRATCYVYNCKYDHDELDPEMRNTLRYVARRIPCSQGMKCRRGDCYYGHQCPWGSDACTNYKVRVFFFSCPPSPPKLNKIIVWLHQGRHARCYRPRDRQIRTSCSGLRSERASPVVCCKLRETHRDCWDIFVDIKAVASVMRTRKSSHFQKKNILCYGIRG